MIREVLVSGAGSDIGIEICRQYLSKKYKVWGLYNQGQPALNDLAKEYPELTLHPLNFESPQNIENFIKVEQKRLLVCDIFVHAARKRDSCITPFSNIFGSL